MKRVSLTVCGIFLLLVSTSILSATEDVVKAQLATGVNGQGSASLIICGLSQFVNGDDIQFSASPGPTGSISGGTFSIDTGDDPGDTWSGSINSGSFNTDSYQLTGQLSDSDTSCGDAGGGTVPNIGDTATISGNCGDNVPIQFSMSNNQVRGTFTGNVQCVVPQPIPIPPPDTDCSVPPTPSAIVGTEGSDRLTGTNGNDLMLGLDGNDRMDGVSGNDRMNGCDGNDSVNGNAGNDGITGGPGNDAVSGGEGDDNVLGGEGNDIVSGDAGTNTLTGGPGRDSFFCSPNSETTISDFEAGVDRITGPCILAPVNPVNNNPDAVDDTISISEDTDVIVSVLDNDTDVDRDALPVQSGT